MICRTCSEEKDESEFYVRRDRGVVRPECKACTREKNRASYEKNRERRKAKVREWQKANPDKVRASQRRHSQKRHLAYNFGMTPEDWHRLLIAQSGRCAICSEPMLKPCVDHCHETGAVRGLLCKDCNTGIGHLKDDIARLQAAIDYLGTFTPA